MAAQTPGADWWVVWDANSGAITVVQLATKPATPASGKVFGPYTSQAEAQAHADPNSSIFQLAGLGASAGAGQAGGSFSNPLSGIQAVGAFFNKLGDPHTWLRLAEIAVGVILLAVAANALLKQSTGTSLTDVVPAGRALKAVA